MRTTNTHNNVRLFVLSTPERGQTDEERYTGNNVTLGLQPAEVVVDNTFVTEAVYP